jgi:hypothetical protein
MPRQGQDNGQPLQSPGQTRLAGVPDAWRGRRCTNWHGQWCLAAWWQVKASPAHPAQPDGYDKNGERCSKRFGKLTTWGQPSPVKSSNTFNLLFNKYVAQNHQAKYLQIGAIQSAIFAEYQHICILPEFMCMIRLPGT